MAFSFVVEMLNMVMRNRMKAKRVVELNELKLEEPYRQEDDMAK
jgi:hypothetical protein